MNTNRNSSSPATVKAPKGQVSAAPASLQGSTIKVDLYTAIETMSLAQVLALATLQG
jgi:hypothetical protein